MVRALNVLGIPFHLVLAGGACERGYGDIRPELDQWGYPYTAMPTVLSARTDWAMSQTTGLTLLHLSQWLEEHRPRLLCVVADRYEVLAPAIAARYQRIPLLHLLGGERSGNVDDRVRSAITQLADLHCVATVEAKRVLTAAHGVDERAIVVTGCPSVDLVREAQWFGSATLPGVGSTIDVSGPYGVVLWHPVTTHAETMAQETAALIASLEAVGVPLVWLWPNVDSGADAVSKTLRVWRERGPAVPVHFVTHLPAVSFLGLLHQSVGLVGNSSVGVREAGALGVRVVDVGDRQVGRVSGGWVTHQPVPDAAGIRDWWSRPKLKASSVYGVGDAGYKVAEVIARQM